MLTQLGLLAIATAGALVSALFAIFGFLRTRQLSNLVTLSAAQMLRAETEIIRGVVEQQSSSLRQELGNSLKGFQQLTITAFGTLRDGINAQVGGFGERLDVGIKAVDERAVAISARLDEEMTQMRSEANASREALRTWSSKSSIITSYGRPKPQRLYAKNLAAISYVLAAACLNP